MKNTFFIVEVAVVLAFLLLGSVVQAQCSGGGVYDPQGGVCHQPDGGYTDPNSTQGGARQVASDYWGALSVDPSPGGRSASSLSQPSRQRAEQGALKKKKKKN